MGGASPGSLIRRSGFGTTVERSYGIEILTEKICDAVAVEASTPKEYLSGSAVRALGAEKDFQRCSA